MKKRIIQITVLTILLIFNMFLIYFTKNSNTDQNYTAIQKNPLTESGITVTSPSDLNLSINDPANHTISWTLTEDSLDSLDYRGAYSFTTDPVGSDPAGWDVTEDIQTSIQVIESKINHHKVVELLCESSAYNSACRMWHLFSTRTTGTMELWVYIVEIEPHYGSASDSTVLTIDFKNGGNTSSHAGPTLGFDGAGAITYIDGSTWYTIGTWSTNKWQHYRVDFNATSNTFDLYQDGVKIGDNCNFRYSQDSIDRVFVGYGFTQSPSVECEAYVDAIDFSWAPGYYPNRNMEYEPSPKDYLGVYSFTEDADGSDPAGWVSEETTNGEVFVISSRDDHHKVVFFDADVCGDTGIKQEFLSNYSTGTVELWVYINSLAWRQFTLLLLQGGYVYNNVGPCLSFATGSDIRYLGPSLPYEWIDTGFNWQANCWMHVKIAFDALSSIWNAWVDETQVVCNASFFENQTAFDRIEMGYYWSYNNAEGEVYVDAIDYSWAPGYYPNRNMEYEPSPTLNYAVFVNGIRQTSWQSWSNQVLVNYDVMAPNLGMGIHNVSLVYNDNNGQWYHDDVTVIVNTTVVVDWYISPDLEIEIDIGRDRDCSVTFTFQNTGNATLIGINFSIFYLPNSWSAEPVFQVQDRLDPGENIVVSFQITVGPSDKEFTEWVIISFEATVMETDEPVTDLIPVLVAGAKYKNTTIWIILIIGSVAAAATTSYIIIKRREIPSIETKLKSKSKSLTLLESAIIIDFPGTILEISTELIERIKGIKGLSDAERDLLIQDVMRLDEEEAKRWIDDFEKTLSTIIPLF